MTDPTQLLEELALSVPKKFPLQMFRFIGCVYSTLILGFTIYDCAFNSLIYLGFWTALAQTLYYFFAVTSIKWNSKTKKWQKVSKWDGMVGFTLGLFHVV